VLLPARRRGRDLLPQHRPLELAELLAGLDAQLLREHRPGPAVRGQRIGLPSAAVQREHQKPPQPLAERIPVIDAIPNWAERAAAAEDRR
jgi:hypothetical protein